MEKKEKDHRVLCANLQENSAIAREREEWKKKFEDMYIAFKEQETKHLKALYMARVSLVTTEVKATMISSDGSRVTRPKTKAQELCAPREPGAPQETSQSVLNPRNTIPDLSDTYLAPQFQESFNQLARAAMNEINRTTVRTLCRVVPSQRLDHSSSSSKRIPRAIVPTGTTHGGTTQKSRVVDTRKNLTVRNQFVQVAVEHPRACLNGMG